MTISIVQNPKVSTSLANLAFTSNVTAGNLLLACFGFEGGTANVTGDSQGNTWVKAISDSGSNSGDKSSIWYATAKSTGACTVDCSGTASGCNFFILEATGINTLDKTASADYNSTATTTPSVGPTTSTTQANELVVAIFYCGNNAVSSGAGGGWVTTISTGNNSIAVGTDIVSSIGTQSTTVTCASTTNYGASIATFYQATPVVPQPQCWIVVTKG